MHSKLSSEEHIRAVFRDAARRAILPLEDGEVDALTQRVLFTSDVRPDVSTKLKEIISQIRVRPSSDAAAETAARLRWFLGAGEVEPLFELPAMLDDRLDVLLFPVTQSKFTGGCALIDGSAFIFISDADLHEALFNCAHQLGHLVTLCARQGHSDGAALDAVGDGGYSARGPYEHFADAFAAELLIPARGLGIALQNLRKLLGVNGGSLGDIELLYLARIFGVNFLAMARRCERARLLPKGGAATLNKFVTEEFGGPERRAEELSLPPRPSVEIASVPRSIRLAVAEEIERNRIRPEKVRRDPSRPKSARVHPRP
jgi:Zn-dependent peptidase ImmA (M78 family)